MAASIPGTTRSDAFKFVGEQVEALAVSPQLVRWGGVDAEHVEYLARDIAAHGQQAPVLIRKRTDGLPELVAGRHRREAVLKINASPADYGLPATASVPLLATYRDLSDEEAIRASFAENTGRPLTCMDLAQAAHQLANVLEWDGKKIAETLSAPHHHVGPARVSQLRQLMRLPVAIQKRLHSGALPESIARAMLRLELSPEDMKAKAAQLEKGEIKASEITSEANAKRRAAGKKVKRSLSGIRAKLEELGTAPAIDFLSWIDAELDSDERIAAIFTE